MPAVVPHFRRWIVPVLLVAAGCTAHQVVRNSSGAPDYERVAITYRSADLYRLLPPEALADERVVPAAASDDQPVELPIAELSVLYPHPQGIADQARLVLKLVPPPPDGFPFESRSNIVPAVLEPVSRRQAEVDWASHAATTGRIVGVLDVPKSQLDLLILDVAHSGYFQDSVVPTATAQVTFQIDKGETSKPWSTIPRLDDLAARTFEAGVPPGTPQGPPQRTIVAPPRSTSPPPVATAPPAATTPAPRVAEIKPRETAPATRGPVVDARPSGPPAATASAEPSRPSTPTQVEPAEAEAPALFRWWQSSQNAVEAPTDASVPTVRPLRLRRSATKSTETESSPR